MLIKLSHTDDVDEVNQLELQRRRLLRQEDWLGLDRSKPLHLEFASDRGREMVAKRRKLDEHDHVRVADHAPYRVPSIRGQCRPYRLAQRGALEDNESIRIRIGDAALFSQTDAASRAPRPSARSHNISSESMLLDAAVDERALPEEDDLEEHIDASSIQATKLSSHIASQLEYSHVDQDDGSNYENENVVEGVHRAENIWNDMDDDNPHRDGALPEDYEDRLEQAAMMERYCAVLASAARGSLYSSSGSSSQDSDVSPNEVLPSETPAFPFTACDLDQAPDKNDQEGQQQLDEVHDKPGAAPGATASQAANRPSLRGKNVSAAVKIDNADRAITTDKHHDMFDILPIPPPPQKHKVMPLQVSHSYTKSGTALAKPIASYPKSKAKYDPDAAWRAFIFDDADSEDGSHLFDDVADHRATADRVPSKSAAETPAPSSSSLLLFTSPTGVGPPSTNRMKDDGIASDEVPTSSFPYDRPSSIANASTTATVLHDKAGTTMRSLRTPSQYGRLQQAATKNRGVFAPPPRYVGAHAATRRERVSDENAEDQIEDIEDSE